MADIKVQLIDLDVELDVPQDRQFPLSLNFESGSLKDIESRSSNYSLEFRIPATKRNKSALDHLDSTNIEDGNGILARANCVVKVDGMPVFRGDFKLMGVVDDRGHKEFKCIILGHAQDWAEGMKNKTLKDYEWTPTGSPFTYSEANVQSSWTNDYTDGYVFPLVNYGAWKYARKVKAEEFRPAIFMRALFEKAFSAEGYKIQTDTDADDFFHTSNNPLMDTVIFPFTGSNWVQPTSALDGNTFSTVATLAYDQHEAYAQVDEVAVAYPKTYRITSQSKYTIKAGLANAGEEVQATDVRRFYFKSITASSFNSDNYIVISKAINAGLNSPDSKTFAIVGYGTRYNKDPYGDLTYREKGDKFFIDVLTSDDLDTFAYNNNGVANVPFNVQVCTLVVGTDNPFTIDLSTPTGGGASKFDASTDKFTADEAIAMKFRFDAKFYAYGINDALINPNEGEFTFRIRHKRGSTISTRGFERVSPTDVSNIDEYKEITSSVNNNTFKSTLSVIRVGFECGIIQLQAGDEVWVDLVSRFEAMTPVVSELKKTTNPAFSNYKLRAFVTSSTLASIPQTDVEENNSFLIQDKLDDRYSTLAYIKGCMHAFNLMIDTDRASKVVKIKTRANFYDSTNPVDWTNKIDSKKQYVIDYLDYYRRNLDFQFKADSTDGYVSELNNQREFKLGSYREFIGNRFADGIQKMENPLFAYTHHLIDTTLAGDDQVKGLFVPRIWKEYAPNSVAPAKNYQVRPRMLFYKYSQQDGTDRFFMYNSTKVTTIPNALPCDFGTQTPSLSIGKHLGYNPSESNDKGLVEEYYENTVNTIEKGTKITVPMVLTAKDIQTFDISKVVYLSYPDEIKGYWLVDSIKQYLPTTMVSTTVELIKYEDYAKRTVDVNYLEEFDEDNKEWGKEGEQFVDIGGGRTGDPKHLTAEEEAMRDWQDATVLFDADRGGVSNKEKKGGGFSTEAAVSKSTASAKMSDARIDEEAEATARLEEQSSSWVNSKGVVSAEKYEALSKDPEQTFHGGNNVDPNVIQRSRGNTSIKAGNAVFGKENLATGRNQMVAGQYAEKAPDAVFAVGAGTSKQDRNTALSVGRDGIVREGGGQLMEEVDDKGYDQVYEEVNGEIIKVTL